MSSRTPILLVLLEGTELDPTIQRLVKGVSITFRERKADTGTLTLSDPDGFLVDSNAFAKGREMAFSMGWTDELEFRGPYVIKSYEPDLPEDGEPKLVVKFQDKSHKMNKKQKRRRFDSLSAVQLLKKLAQENGLGYDLESIEGLRFTDDFPLIQANITDAALIQRLATRYGYVWGVEGNTLYFRRPADLATLNQQGEVRVLSYRTNDRSLMSFKPQIKFTSNRKRKGAKKGSSNLDLDVGKVFDLESARETVSKLPGIGKVVELLPGEETDDDEPSADSVSRTDTQAEAQDAGVERSQGRVAVNLATGVLDFLSDTVEDIQENLETEPGDESGAATPASEEDARRRDAGKVVRASEIVTGTAIPRVASMRWRPGSAVVLAGCGERLSGQYRVKEVTQAIADQTSFQTSMQVERRTFRPSTDAQQKIDEAAASSGDGGTGTQAPPESNPREESVYVDIAQGLVALIDGREDT